jgi:GSH-dependent disulfide-bond oxidoreductase
MIEVYSWATPNGHKVHIMLEECGVPYRAIPVDIGAGDQFKHEFLAISPNNKIPAIVDPDGPDGKPISLFESGAILLYLAGKTGRFLPADVRGRYETLQWLMFQMGGVGPMLGQAHHFRIYAPQKIDYAIERYSNEARRLYGVMNKRLAGSRYIAGPEYTIADIAIFPWLRSWKNQGIDWNEFPHLKGWFDEIAKRPAVVRGVDVLAAKRKPMTGDREREVLFGTEQYSGAEPAAEVPGRGESGPAARTTAQPITQGVVGARNSHGVAVSACLDSLHRAFARTRREQNLHPVPPCCRCGPARRPCLQCAGRHHADLLLRGQPRGF